ncbi:MAG: GNAT family N-acetyltransferase [Chthonomonas sp.]|nr:GNAT family N-acetyltransferase [Chthonomonas sp.]
MNDDLRAARDNLRHTYVELARNVPGTSVHQRGQFTQTVSTAPLTICNMVIDCQIPEADVAQVVADFRLASGRSKAFRVFQASGDQPEDLGLWLMAEGFTLEYSLALMTRPADPDDVPAAMRLVETDAERRTVIDFMVGTFFSRRDPALRRFVMEANLRSPFELWVCGSPGSPPEGAVMLVDRPESLGMYNLCVAPRRRREGVGSGILHFCQAQASARGKIFTFQADSRMVVWYRERGGIEIGSVKIYTNPHKMR